MGVQYHSNHNEKLHFGLFTSFLKEEIIHVENGEWSKMIGWVLEPTPTVAEMGRRGPSHQVPTPESKELVQLSVNRKVSAACHLHWEGSGASLATWVGSGYKVRFLYRADSSWESPCSPPLTALSCPSPFLPVSMAVALLPSEF